MPVSHYPSLLEDPAPPPERMRGLIVARWRRTGDPADLIYAHWYAGVWAGIEGEPMPDADAATIERVHREIALARDVVVRQIEDRRRPPNPPGTGRRAERRRRRELRERGQARRDALTQTRFGRLRLAIGDGRLSWVDDVSHALAVALLIAAFGAVLLIVEGSLSAPTPILLAVGVIVLGCALVYGVLVPLLGLAGIGAWIAGRLKRRRP